MVGLLRGHVTREAISELDVRGIRFQRMSAVVHQQDVDATAP
jgi:hypothetical protein